MRFGQPAPMGPPRRSETGLRPRPPRGRPPAVAVARLASSRPRLRMARLLAGPVRHSRVRPRPTPSGTQAAAARLPVPCSPVRRAVSARAQRLIGTCAKPELVQTLRQSPATEAPPPIGAAPPPVLQGAHTTVRERPLLAYSPQLGLERAYALA